MELTTERLILRRVRQEDREAVIAGLSDLEVSRWLARVPHPYEPADFDEWLGRLRTEPAPGQFTFIIESDGQAIGCIGLYAELGYWLARSHWGRGVMSEAAAAALDWHYAQGGRETLTSGVFVGNHASMRIQHKLGAVVTGSAMVHCRARNGPIERINTVITRTAFIAAARERNPLAASKR